MGVGLTVWGGSGQGRVWVMSLVGMTGTTGSGWRGGEGGEVV